SEMPPQELRRSQYRTCVVALLLPTALKRLPNRGNHVLLRHLCPLSEPRLLLRDRRPHRRATHQVVPRLLGRPSAVPGSPRRLSGVEVHDVLLDESLLSRSEATVMIGEAVHAPMILYEFPLGKYVLSLLSESVGWSHSRMVLRPMRRGESASRKNI